MVLRDSDPEGFARTAGVPRDAWAGEERARRQTRARPREEATIVFCAPKEVARLFRAVMCTMLRRMQELAGRRVTDGEAFEEMSVHAIRSGRR